MNTKQEIKEKVLKQIIRPYHKNSRVTIMRVEDAIDLVIKETSKKIIDKIEEMSSYSKTPYPEDVFIELTKAEQKVINQAIIKAGFTPDKIYGSWGRKIWNNTIKNIKENLGEQFLEEDRG